MSDKPVTVLRGWRSVHGSVPQYVDHTILAMLWSARGVEKRIDDTKDVLRAEIKAFRVEILGEIQALHVEIETQMKQHTAEYHQ